MVQQINGLVRKIPAWPIYILALVHVVWLFYLGITGATGPEPIQVLEHQLGETALQVFIAVLAITPLRKHLKLNFLKFRRALGLAVFLYVAVHLSVWLFLDVQIFSQIISDIIKRPYITIGMIGFVLMIPLALTSNNKSVKKLGASSWNKLHKLTYGAVILGAVHNVMVQKVWEAEAVIYLSIIIGLLLFRLNLKKRLVPA